MLSNHVAVTEILQTVTVELRQIDGESAILTMCYDQANELREHLNALFALSSSSSTDASVGTGDADDTTAAAGVENRPLNPAEKAAA